MKKLKLELDELEVSSFEAEETVSLEAQAETVQANTTVDACYPTLVRPRTCDC